VDRLVRTSLIAKGFPTSGNRSTAFLFNNIAAYRRISSVTCIYVYIHKSNSNRFEPNLVNRKMEMARFSETSV
jgi:hypothetical protein